MAEVRRFIGFLSVEIELAPEGGISIRYGQRPGGISRAARSGAHIERRKAYIDHALFVDMHPFGYSIYRSASSFAVRYAAPAARYAPLRAREPADKPKFEKNKNILLREVLFMTLRDMV